MASRIPNQGETVTINNLMTNEVINGKIVYLSMNPDQEEDAFEHRANAVVEFDEESSPILSDKSWKQLRCFYVGEPDNCEPGTEFLFYDENGSPCVVNVVKTYAGWNGSGLPLGNYLQVGDLVDTAMADYFLNVLPPAYWSSDVIQIGEPVSHKEWGATYATIKQVANKNWMYCGNCYRGQTDNSLPK